MLVTNKTTADIYFGPLHLEAGIGQTLTVDDTSATSLYLLDDNVADALNNAYAANRIDVSGATDPFPRPTGDPKLLHGSGDPEGLTSHPRAASTFAATASRQTAASSTSRRPASPTQAAGSTSRPLPA
jgi:hypothetical protein